MSLPINIAIPQFEVKLHSIEKPLRCRPILVKENKILLMAKQSKNEKSVVDTMKLVLKACILEPKDLDVDSLPTFDFILLYLRLRAKSKDEKVTLRFSTPNKDKCEVCKGGVEVDVNLADVQLQIDPSHSNKIQLTDDIWVLLDYPRVEKLEEINDTLVSGDSTAVVELVASCVKSFYTQEESININNDNRPEALELLENLTEAQFDKVLKFFETMPQLSHTVEIVCPACGYHESYKLETLESFFT